MLLTLLIAAALTLTAAMFLSKQMMLGFPCLIFWAIASGQAYMLSAAVWDIYYFIFWGSIGMAIFSPFASFALRTKKENLQEGDEYIDEGKDDLHYIGDEQESKNDGTDAPSESTRRQALHERAAKRREGRSNKSAGGIW